jgi:thiol-disulfide isomerase/thioredoxin
MKKLSTLSLLLMSFLALCQGIKFEEGNFAGILAKAKKENKLVFLDGYTSWCGPCKYMAKNIFTVQSVGDYYNANFINAKIDMEKGEGKTIAKKYNIVSYPNLLFLNGDGQVVHRINMSLSEEDFLQLGKDAKDPSKQLVLIKKKLEKGENNLDFLKTATTAFIKAQEMNLAEKSLDQYFKQKQKQTNDLTEDETNMLISVLRYNPSGTAYTFLKNRKEDIIKVIPLDLYENYVYSFKLNSISNKAYNKKTNTLNEALFLAEAEKAFGKEKAHKILLRKKANLALNKKDYSTFEKIN